MNLATMTLALYLRNPAQRSHDDLPLIKLPNGRRIVIDSIDYDVTSFGDPKPKFITIYRVHREIGTSHRELVTSCMTMDEIAAALAREGSSPILQPRHYGKKK